MEAGFFNKSSAYMGVQSNKNNASNVNNVTDSLPNMPAKGN